MEWINELNIWLSYADRDKKIQNDMNTTVHTTEWMREQIMGDL